MWQSFKGWLRKTGMLLAVVLATFIIFGDWAQIAVTLYNLSVIAFVLLVSDFILDSRKNCGIYPKLDLDRAHEQAIRSPIGAALTWIGHVALLIAIIHFAVAR